MNKKILLFISILLSFTKIYSQEIENSKLTSNDKTFTIAVIPDSQGYVHFQSQKNSIPKYKINAADIFVRQIRYIVNNSKSNGGNIVFATHVGDIVGHHKKRKVEWKLADKALKQMIDVLPYGFVPGNHDYDYSKKRKDKTYQIYGTKTYSSYFGPRSKYFKNKEWYGGASPNSRNSYAYFEGAGQKFMFLGLEIEPSNETILWAQKILDENKDIPTICVTHEYISSTKKDENLNSIYLTDSSRVGFDRNTPEQLWEKLISKNNQIFLVLCGHHFNKLKSEGLRTDINDDGYKVYSMLTDYQGRTATLPKFTNKDRAGGDGWLRLLHFDLEKKTITAETYSTELEIYEKDENSFFTLNMDWDWEKRFSKEN